MPTFLFLALLSLTWPALMIAVPTSCPTALYIALRHLDESFETMMRFTIECGGDVDTIGAISGALWGIVNGAGRLPPVRLESRKELACLARRLFQRQSSAVH